VEKQNADGFNGSFPREPGTSIILSQAKLEVIEVQDVEKQFWKKRRTWDSLKNTHRLNLRLL